MALPTLEQQVPRQDLEIKQNADLSFSMLIISRDDNDVAEIIDTAGWEVLMQVRPEPVDSSPVLLEASTSNGMILVGIQGSYGEEINVDVKVPASITAQLAWFGCAGYDILCIYPGGAGQDYYMAGQAQISPAYSRE